jgi:tryptophan halogenase
MTSEATRPEAPRRDATRHDAIGHDAIGHVVVVGGGSAGWLTAGLLAAEHNAAAPDGLRVTLIESPDVPTIGVGEGTWPTMRDTLRRIGVSETDFVRRCDVAFKQGSKFLRWTDGADDDAYHHPFVLPHGYPETNPVPGWLARPRTRFAELTSVQPRLCEAGKGPKQFSTPEFAAVANYAYHLDAARLGVFLREHCTAQLGVHYVQDHVDGIDCHDDGDITALRTRASGAIAGDLFVDCTGLRALLLGKHYGVPLREVRDVLFNDRALALQVPHATPDAPVACQTLSTAHACGWSWDIALPTRRGIGLVYSSAHASDEAAERILRAHVRASGGDDAGRDPLRLTFTPGFRERGWHRNCVAIGLSAGFVEPLEASSLVLVELAAAMLAEQLPATRAGMDHVAARFNDAFTYRFERVVEFLKLHYVLSRRDGDYWRDHRRVDSIPARLREQLEHWRQQPPSRHDLHRVDEVFPSASYQYILYGMDVRPQPRATTRRCDDPRPAAARFAEVDALARRMLPALPDHRALLDHVALHGMPPI